MLQYATKIIPKLLPYVIVCLNFFAQLALAVPANNNYPPSFEEAVKASLRARPSVPCRELANAISYVGPTSLTSPKIANLPILSNLGVMRYDPHGWFHSSGALDQYDIEHQHFENDSEKWFLVPRRNAENIAEVVWILYSARKVSTPLTIYRYLPGGVCKGCSGIPFIGQNFFWKQANWPGKNGMPKSFDAIEWAKKEFRKSTGSLGKFYTKGYSKHSPYRHLITEYDKEVEACTRPGNCKKEEAHVTTEYLTEELCTVAAQFTHTSLYQKAQNRQLPAACNGIPLSKWSDPTNQAVASCIMNYIKGGNNALNEFNRWHSGYARLVPVLGTTLLADDAIETRECKDNLLGSVWCWSKVGASAVLDATIVATPIAKAGSTWGPAALRKNFTAAAGSELAAGNSIRQVTAAEAFGWLSLTSDAALGVHDLITMKYSAGISRLTGPGVVIIAILRKKLPSGARLETQQTIREKTKKAGGTCVSSTKATEAEPVQCVSLPLSKAPEYGSLSINGEYLEPLLLENTIYVTHGTSKEAARNVLLNGINPTSSQGYWGAGLYLTPSKSNTPLVLDGKINAVDDAAWRGGFHWAGEKNGSATILVAEFEAANMSIANVRHGSYPNLKKGIVPINELETNTELLDKMKCYDLVNGDHRPWTEGLDGAGFPANGHVLAARPSAHDKIRWTHIYFKTEDGNWQLSTVREWLQKTQ